MKKVLEVTKLNRVSPEINNALIVAYRSNGKLYHQNIEGGELRWNEKTSEFSINFKMLDGDVLVMGDAKGMAKKGEFRAE